MLLKILDHDGNNWKEPFFCLKGQFARNFLRLTLLWCMFRFFLIREPNIWYRNQSDNLVIKQDNKTFSFFSGKVCLQFPGFLNLPDKEVIQQSNRLLTSGFFLRFWSGLSLLLGTITGKTFQASLSKPLN